VSSFGFAGADGCLKGAALDRAGEVVAGGSAVLFGAEACIGDRLVRGEAGSEEVEKDGFAGRG
jgi:hypothetical protein